MFEVLQVNKFSPRYEPQNYHQSSDNAHIFLMSYYYLSLPFPPLQVIIDVLSLRIDTFAFF